MIARRLLSAMVIAVLALPVFADNTLIPAERTRLLVVDGKDAKTLDIDARAGIPMSDGRHQIVFQIRTLVREGNDNRMYTSTPYIMSFDLKGDQTYRVQPPNLRNIQDTRNFERSPADSFSLVDAKGNSVPFEFATFNRSGLMLGNIESDIQKFNLTDDPAAVKELTGATPMPVATTPVATTAALEQTSSPKPAPQAEAAAPASESMLKYWYNQADQETRNKFLQWVAEQH